MSFCEPGLPRAFAWHNRRFEVAAVAGAWKAATRDRGELYLRGHGFEVLTATGERMTLYCERQTKNRNRPKARWWRYKLVH